MPIEHGPIGFWKEFEAELAARSEGRYTLSPVRMTDFEWLRRAEPSPDVDEALARVLHRGRRRAGQLFSVDPTVPLVPTTTS